MKLKMKIRRVLSLGYNQLKYFFIKLKMFLKYETFDFFNDIDIEVNTACNRRCSYCPNSIDDRGLPKNNIEMKVALYEKIIDELALLNFTGRISPIFYGEPLLRKNLAALIKYTREKIPQADIKITTNGDFLSLEKYQELVKAGASKFLITQHGPSMPKNIKDLFEFLKENPAEKVKIIYSKFEKNTPLYNRGGLIKPEKVDYDPRCLKPHNPLVIDAKGNVILCCNDYFSSVKFGNLEKEKLVDVWNKPAFKKIREELKKRNFKLDICKKCVRFTT